MKQYRNLIILGVLFILYIVAELNRHEPLDWTVTLSKEDKNPYGGYVLFRQLKDIFRNAAVQSYRTPVYNQLNNFRESNSAYLLISPAFEPTKEDIKEIKAYVKQGNYLFASALNMGKMFSDTLGFKVTSPVSLAVSDSTSVNFVNPFLKQARNYSFKRMTIDEFFSKIDTANTTVLGINNKLKADFIKIPHGKGAYFIHASPLCFSNYFMLSQNNNEYVSKAMSYLPAGINKVMWDEYYKLGPAGAQTPLRFFLTNAYLVWALRLSLAGLLVYMFFEMKRRQRIIPVVEPLRNTTLDFVKTVSSVYFNKKDNRGIAQKKVSYFFEFLRHRFHMATQQPDESFVVQLSRKSGISQNEVGELLNLIKLVDIRDHVDDDLLLALDRHIDNFYKQAK